MDTARTTFSCASGAVVLATRIVPKGLAARKASSDGGAAAVD